MSLINSGDSRLFFNDTITQLQLHFNGGAGASGTFTALSPHFSYAAATGAQKTQLESRIGTSLPLANGSGFAALSIVDANATPKNAACNDVRC